MALDRLFDVMAHDREWRRLVVHNRTVPPKPANTEPFPETLHPRLARVLEDKGISRLYSHQARAFSFVEQGKDFVVTTPTASGKSLCYHLPVLHRVLGDEPSRALYLFPTKALSRDQVASVNELNLFDGEKSGVRTQVYDGDTPGDVRRAIREESEIVVTNPYMLHTGILPNHTQWERLLTSLDFVVIDELHTYTGVFGSHVANVVRRLQRLARHYGRDPQFIMASATMANPKELASALIHRPVEWIGESGAPQGERHFFFINPPIVNGDLGLRRSGVEQARRLAIPVLQSGIQALFFERTRNGVEVLVKYLKDLAAKEGFDPERIAGYRGGYLPKLRRDIENGLREGRIHVVVATNALELGIDVGSLDAVVLVGYPGSVASTFQRAGRAGRRQSSSAVFMVAKATATDQYVTAVPDYLFGSSPEHGSIDADNLIIRVNHLKCAAFELPFVEGEAFGGQADTEEILDYLTREARLLKKTGQKWYWAARTFPAENVPLEAGDVDNFVVFDTERRTILAEVDRASAMTTIHPDAIYNHQGEQYYVDHLDYEGRRAHVTRAEVDYFTEAVVEADLQVRHIDREQPLGVPVPGSPDIDAATQYWGQVGISKIAPMYKKIRFYTRENVGAGDIRLPAEDLETEGLILAFDEEMARETGVLGGVGASSLTGAARLMRKVIPLFVRCDPGDIGVDSEACSSHFEKPTLFMWDEVPGGVGLAEKAFDLLPSVLRAMRDVVTRCPCRYGCPACIGASLGEEVQDKGAITRLLEIVAPPAAEPAP